MRRRKLVRMCAQQPKAMLTQHTGKRALNASRKPMAISNVQLNNLNAQSTPCVGNSRIKEYRLKMLFYLLQLGSDQRREYS